MKPDIKQDLSVTQAATVIGVSTVTLRKYDRQGVIKSKRTTGGHRRYALDDLLRFKKDFLKFERQGATLARKIFLNTRRGNKDERP